MKIAARVIKGQTWSGTIIKKMISQGVLFNLCENFHSCIKNSMGLVLCCSTIKNSQAKKMCGLYQSLIIWISCLNILSVNNTTYFLHSLFENLLDHSGKGHVF